MTKKLLGIFCAGSLSLASLAGCGKLSSGSFADLLGSLPATSAVKTRIAAAPLNVHPRLWLTPEDLPALQARANVQNPYYVQGLQNVALAAKKQMDDNIIPGKDPGQGRGWIQYPTEMYAMLFAFMSLVESEKSIRDDYGQRARKLMMHMIDQAALGVAPNTAYRDPYFNISDRSFMGEAFPLAVDWAYSYFSSEDKAKIRQVFLRWISENQKATVTGPYDHPTPIGLVNDPQLLHLNEDPEHFHVRFASNNHFTIHAKNIGLMAMALDAADDPDQSLNQALKNASGAWLYMTDYALNHDAKGGVWPEGWMYASNGLGGLAQLMLGLETSGNNQADLHGKQVVWDNPFWEQFLEHYIHSLSPGKSISKGWEWLGESYQPAFFGDGENYYSNDMIKVFGPMALHYKHTGNQELFDKVRWLLIHAPAGGQQHHLERLRTLGSGNLRDTITQYMIFDPQDPAPADPRPQLDTTFIGNQGRVLSRTSWQADAAWMSYKLGWARIDHQQGDGNMFEFYRKGEWLTKKWVGYGPSSSASEFCNTLAIENERGRVNGGFQEINWKTGSQHTYTHSQDGFIESLSSSPQWLAISGDSTGLYNARMDGLNDVQHASRSLLWLKPDTIVIYDRAETKTNNRFKRFWLNFASRPQISEHQALVTSPKGQSFKIQTLLPEQAELSVETSIPNLAGYNETAQGETMQYRLKVEDPTKPAKTAFLHVLQASDSGQTSEPALALKILDGDFVGVQTQQTAVLMPQNLYQNPQTLRYLTPSNTRSHLIMGLQPKQKYLITVDANQTFSVQAADHGLTSDAAGLLAFTYQQGQIQAIETTQTAFKFQPDQASPTPTSVPSSRPSTEPSSVPSPAPIISSTPIASSSPMSTENVGIQSLQVEGYDLNFDPEQHVYTLQVPAGTAELKLRVQTVSEQSRLYINSNPAQANQWLPASTWKQRITVAAISQDWHQEANYVIELQNSEPSPVSSGSPLPGPEPTPSSSENLMSPDLLSLKIEGYELDFDPKQQEYELSIPGEQADLNILAETSDPSHRLYINSNPAQSGQLNQASTWHDRITVTVISQDWHQEKEFVIHLKRLN